MAQTLIRATRCECVSAPSALQALQGAISFAKQHLFCPMTMPVQAMCQHQFLGPYDHRKVGHPISECNLPVLEVGDFMCARVVESSGIDGSATRFAGTPPVVAAWRTVHPCATCARPASAALRLFPRPGPAIRSRCVC